MSAPTRTTVDAPPAGPGRHDDDVHVVHDGEHGPDVLLVHGLGGNVAHWHALVPHLVDDHRVRRIDLPGFGRSARTARGTVSDLADAVVDELRHVGRPTVVVGNSMGGLVTMLAARRARPLVAAAVLLGPATPRSRRIPWDDQVAATFGAYATPLGHHALRVRWRELGARGLVDELLEVGVADATRVSDAARRAIEAAVARTIARPDAGVAYLRAVRSLGSMTLRRGRFWQMVDEVDVPTTIVQGELDRLVLLDAAEELVRRRRWPLRVLPGVGHLPQLEVPTAVATTVRSVVADSFG